MESSLLKARTEHDAKPLTKRRGRWTRRCWFLIFAFVALTYFPVGVRGAVVESALEILKKSHDTTELASSYQCLLTDQIRRQSNMFFQRRLPDGTIERSTIASLSPLRIRLQNKEGTWLVDESEAIRIGFDAPRPTVIGEILQLLLKFPNDIELGMAEDEIIGGVSCCTITATLSDPLTRKLANQFRAENKEARLFKTNPNMETLQFVAKRRIYGIGTSDHLLYRYKTYDGNGDLLSEQTASDQRLGDLSESEMFEIPEGWPVFVAHSRSELAKHVREKAKESSRTFWGNIQKRISSLSTNSPSSVGVDIGNQAKNPQ